MQICIGIECVDDIEADLSRTGAVRHGRPPRTKRCAAAIRHSDFITGLARRLGFAVGRVRSSGETATVTPVHAFGEPFGGKAALDFRALEIDLRQHGPGELVARELLR